MSLFKVFQFARKRHVTMQKRGKVLRKNGQVSEISKTMGTQMPAIKKEKERKKKERNEKDSPWSLAKVFSSFKQERYDSRSIVELG
jgi:hypothetical protein